MKNRILFSIITVLVFIGGLAFAQDTTLTITNEGNVGIGTTNPEEKLHIEGDIVCMHHTGSSGSDQTETKFAHLHTPEHCFVNIPCNSTAK